MSQWEIPTGSKAEDTSKKSVGALKAPVSGMAASMRPPLLPLLDAGATAVNGADLSLSTLSFFPASVVMERQRSRCCFVVALRPKLHATPTNLSPEDRQNSVHSSRAMSNNPEAARQQSNLQQFNLSITQIPITKNRFLSLSSSGIERVLHASWHRKCHRSHLEWLSSCSLLGMAPHVLAVYVSPTMPRHVSGQGSK